jgi:hypothetical protein
VAKAGLGSVAFALARATDWGGLLGLPRGVARIGKGAIRGGLYRDGADGFGPVADLVEWSKSFDTSD